MEQQQGEHTSLTFLRRYIGKPKPETSISDFSGEKSKPASSHSGLFTFLRILKQVLAETHACQSHLGFRVLQCSAMYLIVCITSVYLICDVLLCCCAKKPLLWKTCSPFLSSTAQKLWAHGTGFLPHHVSTDFFLLVLITSMIWGDPPMSWGGTWRKSVPLYMRRVLCKPSIF